MGYRSKLIEIKAITVTVIAMRVYFNINENIGGVTGEEIFNNSIQQKALTFIVC